LINLILAVSAGHPASEDFLAQAILDDIKFLEENRCDFFVDHLLMPLIKNEKTIPISFVEKAQKVEESKQDNANWHLNYDVLITEGNSTDLEVSTKPEDNKTFCPSSLFDKPFRKDLMKVFLEK
jgi:hypothetical protein